MSSSQKIWKNFLGQDTLVEKWLRRSPNKLKVPEQPLYSPMLDHRQNFGFMHSSKFGQNGRMKLAFTMDPLTARKENKWRSVCGKELFGRWFVQVAWTWGSIFRPLIKSFKLEGPKESLVYCNGPAAAGINPVR